MSNITTSDILSHINKSPAIQTTVAPEATKTPSGAEAEPQTELRRSDRSRARSVRAKEGGYDKKLAVDKQRAARAQRTRSRNKKTKSSHTHSDAESSNFGFASAPSETDNDGRAPSRSPTPIATADEPEAQTTRSNLQDKLAQKFDNVLKTYGTQTLMEVDDAISTDPAYTSQPEEQGSEARFLSPVVVGAGGGFHLDHPAHRAGNSRTYSGSKGGPRTIAVSNLPVPAESTQPEDPFDAPYIQPFSTSEQEASLPPLNPLRNLESRFFATPGGSGLFLGYPDAHRSTSHVSLDNNLAPSRSPSIHSPTPSLDLTHMSISSKSLGDPILTPPLALNHLLQSTEQHSTRAKGHAQKNTTAPSQTPAHSQAKRPLVTPATPLPARKRQALTYGPTTGGKAYTTRLNITEINSQRVSSREVSRRRPTSSQTRRKGKNTPRTRARTQTPSPIPHPPRSADNNLDLLDDSDADQLVVDSAKQGILVETPGYRKPTAQDLSGHERVFWKETLDLVWAFSMGEGNFQTRTIFASWVSACYLKVLELKLPNSDTASMTMSDDMKTVILNYLCNMRYQDYLRLCDHVRNYYHLKNPSTPDERQDMRDKISELYPDYFHYRETNDPADPYEGHILYIALESVFFWGPNAIGAKYPSLFRRSDENPKDERKHLAVLAYLATMVQFCLGEWTKGYFKKGTLNATTQHSVWLCHFDGLKNVSLIARKRLIKTYNEWVQNAYDASQAQTKFVKKHYVQAVVRQKDVRPDTPSRSPSPLDNY
ncbi:hypothetical protein RSOL_188090, partial [Rhizoctonia solani AG-3 Rhs1AP]